MQASMEGVANASAWLEEEAADMDGKQGARLTWVVCAIRDVHQYDLTVWPIQHYRYPMYNQCSVSQPPTR